MALPPVLKNFNLFVDGGSYLGKIAEVSMPELVAILEDYRAGGMNSAVKLEMGMEPAEFEWKPGGLLPEIYKQWGVTTLDGVLLRFAGAYEAEDTGAVTKVEIILRGRHGQIAPGTAKAGEVGETTVTTHCVYYRLEVAGKVLIENDVLGMKLIVDGVDRLAAIRAAIEA